MEKRIFGRMPDGQTVDAYTLRSGALTCRILTYGGALQALTVPGRNGLVDVLLGFDTLEDYRRQDKYIGAIIGRFANRIGGARFSLGGRDYRLAANDGPNHLHGGTVGFDKRVWAAQPMADDILKLSLTSADGEEGYPGALQLEVLYRMTQQSLVMDCWASCNQDTLCNLTNHAYFNLSGHDSGRIEEQLIQIQASHYTPTDAGSIPTGALEPVAGTPMDLREPIAIGLHADDAFAQLRLAGGYDHNWAVAGPVGTLRPCARAYSPRTGITLEVSTTQAGVQFYSGNYLDGCPAGKGGAPYARRWGFCLETQTYPDAPHHPGFPSAFLAAGERYHHTTIYAFR